MTAPRIPVVVVAGYLGAGKTTLINRVLSTAREPIAVVVNDFGSVNIDSTLIRATHGDTIELTNGCICCVVGGSLADVLFEIDARETRPHAVIIEASGVADPAAVASYAHLGGFRLAGTIVLVDAQNAPDTDADRLVGTTFRRQVRCADVILLTKLDLSPHSCAESTREIVRSINPDAPLVDVTAIDLDDLFDVSTPTIAPVDERPHGRFTSALVDVEPRPNQAELLMTLDALPLRTVRAKGIIELADGSRVLVQRVGRHTSVTPTELPPTGLVTISVDD